LFDGALFLLGYLKDERCNVFWHIPFFHGETQKGAISLLPMVMKVAS
jgi:hypothetical protein